MPYCVKGRSKQRDSRLGRRDIDGSQGASCPTGAWFCDDNVHPESAVNAA
jgi:hypothetical protein